MLHLLLAAEIGCNVVRSDLSYIITKTVGVGKDYATISEAVAYLHTIAHTLSMSNKAQLLIDPGVYLEWLCAYYESGSIKRGLSLYSFANGYGTGYVVPAYVDFIRAGTSGQVNIKSNNTKFAYGQSSGMVRVLGGNYFENIKIEGGGVGVNTALLQTSIDNGYADDLVELKDCITWGSHGGVQAGKLKTTNCQGTGTFGSCFYGGSYLEIKDCIAFITAQSDWTENMIGVAAGGDIMIDGLTSVGSANISYQYNGELACGIHLTNGDSVIRFVDIKNVNIDWDIAIIYPSNTGWWYIGGIFAGPFWQYAVNPNGYKCYGTIKNSSININVTEESGAGAKVGGVWSRGGVKLNLHDVDINTSRVGDSPDGFCYDIIQETGLIKPHPISTVYNTDKVYGSLQKVKLAVA